jgi:murein DD-endopeptidase MepM/ murein hydrolase activator NlpD
MHARLLALLAGLALAVLPARAGPPGAPELSLPIACEPGKTCWVLNYVDLDTGPETRDFGCGRRTYDGHDGTDFALKDLGVMQRGVKVLASAGGIVKAVRDGMEDVNVKDIGRASLGGKDCGNGVVIDHGFGWETQYCHLKRGSVTVKKGEPVPPGHVLGLVGMSGFTEFPHVHMAVRKNGQAVDPHTGAFAGEACGGGPGGLWKPDVAKALPYESLLLLNAGFSDTEPTRRPGRPPLADPQPVRKDAQFMYFWIDAFGIRPDDEIHFKVVAPGRQVLLEHTLKGQRHRPYYFQWLGIKRVSPQWTNGAYVGEVRIVRAGEGAAGIERKIYAEAVVY